METKTRNGFKVYRIKSLRLRPPKTWWRKKWPEIAATYPRKQGETEEEWKKDISRILAGVWWKLPEETKKRLIRRYERTNNNPVTGVGSPVRNLACPTCGTLNPTSRANVYLRCAGCGRPLASVKVRRK